MDFLAGFILLPNILIFGLLIGWIHLFSVFGFLYTLPVFIGATLVYFFKKRSSSLSLPVFCILTLGSLLTFFSWLLSKRTIDASQATHTWGNFPSASVAGFPLRTMELPPSPLGVDRVPVEMWRDALLNEWFWFVTAIVIVFVLFVFAQKKFTLKSLHLAWFFIPFVIVLYNLALFTLWFD